MNWTAPLVTTCSQLVERVEQKLSTSRPSDVISDEEWNEIDSYLILMLIKIQAFFCKKHIIESLISFPSLTLFKILLLVILAVFDHKSMGHNLDMKGGKFLCKTWARTDCPHRAGQSLGPEIVVNIWKI